jgi:hypothetical protein
MSQTITLLVQFQPMEILTKSYTVIMSRKNQYQRKLTSEVQVTQACSTITNLSKYQEGTDAIIYIPIILIEYEQII